MANILQLGEFIFLNEEIPASLPFGGTQAIGDHHMIGGSKQLNAMGYFPDNYSWSGLFFGENADFRARYVDGMAKSGKTYILSYSGASYEVKIARFRAAFEGTFKIPYSITVVVQKDLTNPIDVIPIASFDQEIDKDLYLATGIADLLQNQPISGAIAALNQAVANLDLDNATVIEINNAIAIGETANNVINSQISIIEKDIFG